MSLAATWFWEMQDVPLALLVRFLREHCLKWANPGVDVYSDASFEGQPIRSSNTS